MRVVLDTNILESAVLVRAPAHSPPVVLFRAAIARRSPFLLSEAIIAEYDDVLRRPEMAALHGMGHLEVAAVLVRMQACGTTVAPPRARLVPADPNDQHVVDLASIGADVLLVTGDKGLLILARQGLNVVTARDAVGRLRLGDAGQA